MEFSCPEGHIVYTTWGKLRDNFNCLTCASSNISGISFLNSNNNGINNCWIAGCAWLVHLKLKTCFHSLILQVKLQKIVIKIY